MKITIDIPDEYFTEVKDHEIICCDYAKKKIVDLILAIRENHKKTRLN